MGEQLPNGWEIWNLADIGEWLGGGTPSKANKTFWEGNIPWVSPKDMKKSSIVDTQDSISVAAVENSAAKIISSGSVLFVTRSGILAHSFPTATTRVDVTINQDLKAITPVEAVDSQYLAWSLRSCEQKILRTCRKHGTTVHSLEMPTLKEFQIPLAPLNEQRRIVAKIEELFSELDKGVESLKAARVQLRTYRQAVLKHAFEGKLTANWREENKDKLEPADKLLARIKHERETRYQQQLKDWQQAVKKWEGGGKEGKKPGKPKKLAQLSELSKEEQSRLAPLPTAWIYSRVGLLIDEPKYGTSKKCDYEYDGLGVLRIPNIVSGLVDDSDMKFAEFDDEEIQTYGLNKGDILIIRSNGSVSIVGKCALISEHEEQYLYAGYLIRLRPNNQLISSKYLLALLSSHLLRAQIEAKAKSTSGVNNINSGELQSLIIPVCSLEEQSVIMGEISAALSSIDNLENEIDSQLQKSKALRQSILKKAFSGELVAQDPGDEPASALLERIRAEKSAQSKPKPKAKTKKKKRAA